MPKYNGSQIYIKKLDFIFHFTPMEIYDILGFGEKY